MKNIYQKILVVLCFMVLGGLVLLSSAQPAYAAERLSGWSKGGNLGVAKLFDDDLGFGFSGRAFLEYAPYIHEIALRLTGGYLRFQDTIEIGRGIYRSEEDVIFEDFYLTGGVIYRFSRKNIVPFATANVGLYHYRKEDVESSAVGTIIDGSQVSPYDSVEYKDGFDIGANLGGGLEFFTSPSTSVSMEFLLHTIFGEVDNQVADFTVMFRFFPEG